MTTAVPSFRRGDRSRRDAPRHPAQGGWPNAVFPAGRRTRHARSKLQPSLSGSLARMPCDFQPVGHWGCPGSHIRPFTCLVAQEAFVLFLLLMSPRRQHAAGIAFKKSLKDVPPDEIVRLVEEGKVEPVARQLFREAWALKDFESFKRTRHSMAAAELGVKDWIAALVPNAQWLAKEIPSPPLFKILRDYVPTLPGACAF